MPLIPGAEQTPFVRLLGAAETLEIRECLGAAVRVGPEGHWIDWESAALDCQGEVRWVSHDPTSAIIGTGDLFFGSGQLLMLLRHGSWGGRVFSTASTRECVVLRVPSTAANGIALTQGRATDTEPEGGAIVLQLLDGVSTIEAGKLAERGSGRAITLDQSFAHSLLTALNVESAWRDGTLADQRRARIADIPRRPLPPSPPSPAHPATSPGKQVVEAPAQTFPYLDIVRSEELPLPESELRPLAVPLPAPQILLEDGEMIRQRSAQNFASLHLAGSGDFITSAREWQLPNSTTLMVTDRRVLFINTDLSEPDSVAIGTGVVFATAAVISNHRAKKRAQERTAGVVAVGHIRFEWISSLEAQKFLVGGWQYRLRCLHPDGREYQLPLPKHLDPLELVRSVAAHRLATAPALDSGSESELRQLTQVPFLRDVEKSRRTVRFPAARHC